MGNGLSWAERYQNTCEELPQIIYDSFWCELHGSWNPTADRTKGCPSCFNARASREAQNKAEVARAAEELENERVLQGCSAAGLIWAGASHGVVRTSEDVKRLFRLAVNEALKDEEKVQEAMCPLR